MALSRIVSIYHTRSHPTSEKRFRIFFFYYNHRFYTSNTRFALVHHILDVSRKLHTSLALDLKSQRSGKHAIRVSLVPPCGRYTKQAMLTQHMYRSCFVRPSGNVVNTLFYGGRSLPTGSLLRGTLKSFSD